MNLRKSTFVMQFLCGIVGLMAVGAGAFALHLSRYDLAAANGALLAVNVALFFTQIAIRNRR